jgi:hypothetical protein
MLLPEPGLSGGSDLSMHVLRPMTRLEGLAQGVSLWFRLAFMDLRLNILPAAWNRRLLSSEALAVRKRDYDVSFLERVMVDMVNSIRIAASHPLFFNMGCLRRSLVLKKRLGKFGISTALTYGIRKNGITAEGKSTFSGHAWLVVKEPSFLQGTEVDATSQPRLYQELSHAGC